MPSGPLAQVGSPEKGANLAKSREPVDHSVEWTTSAARKPEERLKLGQKLRASGPLAQGGSLEKGSNRGKSWEPVVHFVEWTTSSERNPGKRRKPSQKPATKQQPHKKSEAALGWLAFALSNKRLFSFSV